MTRSISVCSELATLVALCEKQGAVRELEGKKPMQTRTRLAFGILVSFVLVLGGCPEDKPGNIGACAVDSECPSGICSSDGTCVDDRATAIYESQCERTRFRSKAISQAGGLAPCLDRLTMPVLLAWGEHDVTAQPQIIGPQLADGVATRQWRLIRDAGHWVQYERHHAVDALLLDWFDVGAAPAP